jgi:sucrose-6-phosphate hydrolase SacC (GH32 family)
VLTKLVALLVASALYVHGQTGYNQPLRPQVHFSPQHNWTNDPNGLVYFDGEYHLFFQYNPFGDQWGHMSWGHAVSRDLLHWRELPVAIPELKTAQDTEMVFTGSVVVDEKNTSGLCANGKPCMVAVYTGHHIPAAPNEKNTLQNQNLAYSNDKGRTWTRYKGNPVLDLHMADFRDPSVFRDEERSRWVMSVALPREHKVRLYSSPDLKQWTELSDFGPTGSTDGEWECPTMIDVPHQRSEATTWALKVGINPGAPQGGSGEQYFLGGFDGTHFTQSADKGAHGWTNYGKDDYCAISFNHLPKSEPRPILLGWMSNWQYAGKLPTSPWRGQMSLPRRVAWLRDSDGIALTQQPVIEPLRSTHGIITTARELTRTAPFELALRFKPEARGTHGLRLYTDAEHYTEIAFDNTKREFYIDRTHSSDITIAPNFPARTATPLAPSRAHDLHVIVDTISVEAFAQQGSIAMTNLIFPASPKNRIVFFSSETDRPEVKGDVWELKSIWK